jgi:hypoxanthine-DNA glycosylase
MDADVVSMNAPKSFDPVFDEHARILVLGSMPGIRSLQARRYYAHPRNAFWPIMGALLQFDPDSDYSERLAQLASHGVALWDVIARCRRRGSLDQRIETASIVANDFGWLLDRCPLLQRVVFNGRAAEQAWFRHVQPVLPERWQDLDRVLMPSTSPAYASMSLEHKREAWARALDAPA